MGPTIKKSAAANDKTDKSEQKEILAKALHDGREYARKEFEEQRTIIYDTLSPSYKQMFGQIIFAKWKKTYVPALVLSPYCVPPGQVRKMWMDKLEKVRAAIERVEFIRCMLTGFATELFEAYLFRFSNDVH
jgi:hypothetical protein